jgi:hypothetical protein
MSPSNIVVNIADGAIKGPIFIIACPDGYGRFVASKNDGSEGCTMVIRTTCENVLFNR